MTSATLPGPIPSTVDDDVVAALHDVASELTTLGHELTERAPDYGNVANDISVLYLRGIAEDAASVPHPDRLEPRTRGFARLGRMIPDRLLAGALDRQEQHAARINEVFDDIDILMTPVTGTLPVEVGRWHGRGAVRTLQGMARVYPFTAVWNYTGQPAIAVPAGIGRDGLPRSVMFVAPPNREGLLLSLAGQLEAHLAWPDLRPPVD
jgi:amidase